VDSDVIPFTLLFWGAMSRKENSDAAIYFITNFWNHLKASFPLLKLYIVGSDPPSKLYELANKDIIITGFVEDPSWYFEKIKLGIVPLSKGAGVKVKVLEMMSAGLPVVSTPVGAEGIENNPRLFVRDLNDEFLKEIFNQLRS
jgi:glycosyltransferase involved in cell wall biosynthesis